MSCYAVHHVARGEKEGEGLRGTRVCVCVEEGGRQVEHTQALPGFMHTINDAMRVCN